MKVKVYQALFCEVENRQSASGHQYCNKERVAISLPVVPTLIPET
jgi:hypothetical protein